MKTMRSRTLMFALAIVVLSLFFFSNAHGSQHLDGVPCGDRATLKLLERDIVKDSLNQFFWTRFAAFLGFCELVRVHGLDPEMKRHIQANLNSLLIYVEFNSTVPYEMTALRHPLRLEE